MLDTNSATAGNVADMTRPSVQKKYRPSVGTILVMSNLMILVLPLASLLFFRVYENLLIKETEGELIAQAAVLDASFRQAVRSRIKDYATYGVPVERIKTGDALNGPYTPVRPQISLNSNAVLPRRPDPVPSATAPGADMLSIGRTITEAFSDAQRVTLAGMRLLDHTGSIIGGRGDLGASLANVSEVRDALAGRYVGVLRQRISDEPMPPLTSISRGTGVRIFIAYPVLENDRLWGVIYMSRTPSNIFRRMYAARYRLIAIGGLLLGLTILFGWMTSRALLRPIRALSHQARQFGLTRDSKIAPLPNYGTREVATLGESFLDMADALEKRSTYVRNFATHVSHEFKTPLTAIQGATELLREHHDEMEESERQRFLDNIRADTERLKALVDRLNELARADTTAPFTQSIDVAKAVETLAKVNKDVRAIIEVERPCWLPMSDESFDIIAYNLIQNARQAEAARIDVSVAKTATHLEIRFSDNGHGISPGNRDKIYEPFFTTRRESNGTGLGLGIVRSLVEAHNGTVSHRAADNGAIFVIRIAG